MMTNGGTMSETFLPAATTAEKIAAEAQAEQAKGRVGDPANVGLFGSTRDQMDLLDLLRMAQQIEG